MQMASMASPMLTGLTQVGPNRGPSLRGSITPTKVGVPLEKLKETSQLLQAAIQAGDVENAKKFAEQLAMEKVKVNLDLDAETFENRLKEQSFSLKVIIEDRVTTGNAVYLTVKASDTIFDLKKKMMLNYNFPMEVQKWIISRRVAEDMKSLLSYQVKGQGCTAYLYLIMAKSVHLDKDTYEKNRENAAKGRPFAPEMPSGDYLTMANPLNHTMPASFQTNFTTTTAAAAPTPTPRRRKANNPPVLRTSGPLPVFFPFNEQSVEPVVTAMGSGLSPGLMGTKPLYNQQEVGWQCGACTFVNKPTRPGCELCGEERPVDYKVPEGYILSEEEERWIAENMATEQLVHEAQLEQQRLQIENFNNILELDHQDLIPNAEVFDCPICMDTIPVGNGVVLRECLHMFCKDCLMDAVRYNEEAGLKCPYQDDQYSCPAMLQDREVRALVPDEIYERYLKRSLDLAESQAENSYHCKSADCPGWCIYEDMVNFFKCPNCLKENCLTCKAIHEGMNCKQYQEDLKIRAQNDIAAKQTQDMLEKMLLEGNAMHCPKCKIIVQKKDGCDWIKCSICKTEICWVTKGPRWGPNGEGDNSGGCGCRVNGAKCHPNCNNCH